MYSSLKNNLYSICLDSVVLNVSSRSIFISNNYLSFYKKILYTRRRVIFIKHLLNLRSSLFKHFSTILFVDSPSGLSFSCSAARTLNSLRFLNGAIGMYCGGTVKRERRGTRLASVRYLRGSLLYLLRSFYNKVIKSYGKSLKSTALRSTTFAFPSTFFKLIGRAFSSKQLRKRQLKKIKKKSFKFSLLYFKRISYFFSYFFRTYISFSHTCSFYFRMMLNANKFEAGGNRVSFFSKKLLRLYFYQLGLRSVADSSVACATNFKAALCGYSMVDTSRIIRALGLRLFTILTMDCARFFPIIGHISSNTFSGVSTLFATYFGSYVFLKNYSFTSSFLSNICRFTSLFLVNKYRFMLSSTLVLLNRTFNLFVNNSSARNVFSSLNRGSSMIYGTTSGSFKLRKRVRFRKHAMFMVAAKFYRIISHYYKAKLVRSIYLHFTGFRRSFNLVSQFFRTLLRQNVKYHFKTLPILFNIQPSLHATTSGALRSSSFFSRTLPLHSTSVFYSRSSTRALGLYFNKINAKNSLNASVFFDVSVLPLLKRKYNVSTISSKIQRVLPSFVQRYYSSSVAGFPRFVLCKQPILLSDAGVSDLCAGSFSTLVAASLLSPWCFSTVYTAIIRTRRHYKLYKKLVAPLLSRTQIDSFSFGLCFSPRRQLFYFFKSLRSRAASLIITPFLYNNNFSYATSYLAYSPLLSLSSRHYSTTASLSKHRGGRSIRGTKASRIKTKRRAKAFDASSFRNRARKLAPSSYLSVFRTRMAIFLNTIFSGSAMRYRPVISHGGCYKRRRTSDRRYWF